MSMSAESGATQTSISKGGLTPNSRPKGPLEGALRPSSGPKRSLEKPSGNSVEPVRETTGEQPLSCRSWARRELPFLFRNTSKSCSS